MASFHLHLQFSLFFHFLLPNTFISTFFSLFSSSKPVYTRRPWPPTTFSPVTAWRWRSPLHWRTTFGTTFTARTSLFLASSTRRRAFASWTRFRVFTPRHNYRKTMLKSRKSKKMSQYSSFEQTRPKILCMPAMHCGIWNCDRSWSMTTQSSWSKRAGYPIILSYQMTSDVKICEVYLSTCSICRIAWVV